MKGGFYGGGCARTARDRDWPPGWRAFQGGKADSRMLSRHRKRTAGACIAMSEKENGAIDGIRTRDLWYHKPAL